MPERRFDDGFWSNPYTMKLPKDAKILLAYLFTNQHCNQAGLYKIALETITFETGIPEADIPALFELIKEKAKWYPEDNLIWVKNFIARQTRSPQFLVAAGRCLEHIKRKGVVQEFIEYNYRVHTLSIPYRDNTNTHSIPSYTTTTALSISSSKKIDEEVKGKKEEKASAKMLRVYEENIGGAVPIIVERIGELGKIFPAEWFEEAAREAVRAEHRNLKYIEAILARWQKEGFKVPKRKGRSEREGRRIGKKCPSCGWVGVTSGIYCPRCDEKGKTSTLERTYTSQKYGHLVER